MKSSARAASDQIGEGLQELIESAEALLEELKDQQGAAAASLRDRAFATIKSARRRLGDLQPEVSELATRTLKSTVSFVRQDPWRAVAIGALLVVVLGVLASGGDDD
jgi:ElaB/YqjD/DUF883 family membrane-anchored ribosome-binding protein